MTIKTYIILVFLIVNGSIMFYLSISSGYGFKVIIVATRRQTEDIYIIFNSECLI